MRDLEIAAYRKLMGIPIGQDDRVNWEAPPYCREEKYVRKIMIENEAEGYSDPLDDYYDFLGKHFDKIVERYLNG